MINTKDLRKRYKTLRIGGALLFAGFGIGALYLGVDTASKVGEILGSPQVGWKRYFKTDSTWGLVLDCQDNPRCTNDFNVLFNRYFPMWIFFPMAFSFGLVLYAIGKYRSTFNEKAPGLARWTTKLELDKHVVKNARKGTGKYLGVHPDTGQVLNLFDDEHRKGGMIVGSPGARKTVFYKSKLLFQALEGQSVSIAFDTKFPQVQAGIMDMIPVWHRLGLEVNIWTPFFERSMSIDYLKGGEDPAIAKDIAEAVIPHYPDAGDAAYYHAVQREILSRMIWGVCTDDKEKSFGRIHAILSRGVNSMLNYFKYHPNNELRDLSGFVKDLPPTQLPGMVAMIVAMLDVFSDPNVNRATTHQEGSMLDLQKVFEQPGLLYIGVPITKVFGVKGQILLLALKRLLDNAMMSVANRKENGGVLPFHASYLLDEFGQQPRYPSFVEQVNTWRSYNASAWIALQDTNQLITRYGVYEARTILGGGTGTKFWFAKYLGDEDKAMLERSLGFESADEIKTSQGGGVGLFGFVVDPHASESHGQTKRPLMSMPEMRDAPKPMAVVTGMHAPMKVLVPHFGEKGFVEGENGKRVKNPLYNLYRDLLRESPATIQRKRAEHKRQAQLLEQQAKAQGRSLNRMEQVTLKQMERNIETVDIQDYFNAVLDSKGIISDQVKQTGLSDQDLLLAWTAQLLEQGALVKWDASRSTYSVLKESLKGTLSSDLPRLEKYGYLEVMTRNVRLTEKALSVLPDDLKTLLETTYCTLPFRYWMTAHGEKIKNHPAREEKKLLGDLGLATELGMESKALEELNLLQKVTADKLTSSHGAERDQLVQELRKVREAKVKYESQVATLEQKRRQVEREAGLPAPIATLENETLTLSFEQFEQLCQFILAAVPTKKDLTEKGAWDPAQQQVRISLASSQAKRTAALYQLLYSKPVAALQEDLEVDQVRTAVQASQERKASTPPAQQPPAGTPEPQADQQEAGPPPQEHLEPDPGVSAQKTSRPEDEVQTPEAQLQEPDPVATQGTLETQELPVPADRPVEASSKAQRPVGGQKKAENRVSRRKHVVLPPKPFKEMAPLEMAQWRQLVEEVSAALPLPKPVEEMTFADWRIYDRKVKQHLQAKEPR